ncbi:hypothetical protein B0A49_09564, partial [Cryomyces minteri]
MAGTAVDIAFIASAYSIPESTVQTLLDAPTAELVRSFLESVAAKAHELEELKAEKLRSDVELENAVRSGESRARGLKTAVEKGLKEAEELRVKLKKEGRVMQALLAITYPQLNSTWRRKFAFCVGVGPSQPQILVHDIIIRTDELSAQHQKILTLRREVSTLEEKLQTADNASMSTKFREQALQQEVDLLKRNNEWHETELITRSAEYSKFRKEKGARIVELQRLNEDANSTIDSLKRTENTLRQRLDQVGQKADDAFARVQQLQEAAAKADESFRVELDSARRLAELQRQSAGTAKARLQDVQNQLEQTKDDAAEEIGQIQAEVESERANKEAADRRIAELELQVEKFEADASQLQNHVPVPGTPRRSINGLKSVGTPARAGSPAVFSPGSSRTKGTLTFTQLYAEHSSMKAELEAERRRSQKLSATVDEMIQDLETKQPEFEELRMEHERLGAEVAGMSSLLSDSNRERDEAKRQAKRAEGQVQGLTRESDVLRQQLRDLSAQIKILLVEVQARDQGLEALSAAEQMQLERIARGEIDDSSLGGMTDTDRYISQRLTIFRNVNELQKQNADLLKVTRQLGQQMEGEEARAKQNQQEQDRLELESLRERMQRHQDEMKSMVTQSQSYIRERDIFRRMLAHRGQLPPDADVASAFGRSVDERVTPSTPLQGGHAQSVGQTPHSKDMSDYAKVLKELQSHFDAYRQEASTDRSALKEQVDRLAREKGELQGELARGSSQLTLAHERYEMLQANFNMLKGENSELHKRSQTLAENAAKQDLRTQQVAEELVETKGLVDSMRKENANLKAERELWKNIEGRLSEDNRSLMDDRSRLNKMIGDLQSLQNERELSESESRRRLQSRAEALEAELQTTKQKLDSEVEEGKNAVLRREYESDQNRTRIDDLVRSLGNAREELVAAKTTRDQLQARVDEMKIELRSAEERAQVSQPRRISAGATLEEATDREVNGEEALDIEQRLTVEVSELRRDLELARGELESAKAHVEQYKGISQSSEEELQSLNDTYDQYRAEMDRMVSEKDEEIEELKQRLADLSSELTATNTELSNLRTKEEEGNSRLAEQNTIFEAEVARLKDESERYAETSKLHREDLKAQAEIAQQAQQNYEDELVKHADAAKALHKVRTDYNQLRTEVAEIKAEAEAAKAALAQSEESWSEVRDRYERELAELKARREDLNSQNKLLHQQLEGVTLQISTLQQKRTIANEGDDDETTPASGLESLQEVIKYLRREKEIVDVQYELSIQELKRLRQQLGYAQSQLDETRQRLDEERRTQADKEASAMSHNKLMQTINELNLFRESSITLRNEARQAQILLAGKTEEAEDLIAQLQPLQSRVRELENEIETKDGEMRLLQEDRDRWRERTQNIIQKYDRVDPAELESLKTQISTLEGERNELVSEKQALQVQINGVPEQIRRIQEESAKSTQESRKKLIDQAKAKAREQSAKITQANAEVATVRSERDQLAQELSEMKEDLERTKSTRDEAMVRAAAVSQPRMQQQVQQPEDGEEGEVHEPGIVAAKGEPLDDRLSAAVAKAAEESERAAALYQEVETLKARVQELECQVSELQTRLEKETAQLAQLRSQAKQSDSSENYPVLAQLRGDLATAQQEIETLRMNTSDTDSSNPIITIEAPLSSDTSVADQVAEQVAALRAQFETQHQESVKQANDNFQKRAENMKGQLSAKLKEGRDKIRQELQVAHQGELQKLRDEHEEAIERLKGEHRQEMEKMQIEGEAAVERAKVAEVEAPATRTAAAEVKTETPSVVVGDLNLTDAQVKDLVAKNAVVKQIVTTNVRNKLNQEREALIAKTTSEAEAKFAQERETFAAQNNGHHDPVQLSTEEKEEISAKVRTEVESEQSERLSAKLADAATNAKKDLEKAVALEGMKQKAKLGMADNKARTALAKLEVVERAATETPQRPVVEVWAIAKETKPAPVQLQQQVSRPQSQAVNSNQGGHTQGRPGGFEQPNVPPSQQPPSPAVLSAQSSSQAINAAAVSSQAPLNQPNQSPRTQAVGTGPGALRVLDVDVVCSLHSTSKDNRIREDKLVRSINSKRDKALTFRVKHKINAVDLSQVFRVVAAEVGGRVVV